MTVSRQPHAPDALVACGDFTMVRNASSARLLSTIGLGDDPGTDPMPANCNTPGSQIVGRFADCQVGLINYGLWTVPTKPGETPKLVGEAAIGVGSMTRTGWKAPGISRIVKIKMLEAWGRALSGIKVSADIKCLGNASSCKLDDVSKTYVQELSLNRGLYGYANFHSTPTATNDPKKVLRHYMETTVSLRHANEAEPNPYSRSHVSENIRCDKRLPGETNADEGGCVFADLTPFYSLSKTTGTATRTAAHIERAQAATKNHWGRYTGDSGVDKPLTRLQDDKKANDNREIACPDSLPRPPGMDCDEYPFAATYQGAAMEGKDDWHREFIPSSDNRAEGAYRKNWMADFRILDREAFWVNIVP
ncbi:NucA/NucB deoxyribonuclease domain-containing protein [Actinomadura kijaniata]|uniref:NucA/NucB deoxyribonuclease domain-containing protein n=1 Tax=Actinomadura kijaniata TaxID=46161 RepID=UPI003F1AD6C5